MDTRNLPPENEIREVIERAMMRLNTCIPGEIVSFDSSKQTAVVKPTIKMRTFIDQIVDYVELPQILEVPVVFPHTSTFAITLPIAAGDPCLLVFSQRAIDNWHERGGVQPPEEGIGSRHHDLTDAFAIMAPVPLPSALSSWTSDGIEIRNTAKTSRVTVKESTIEIVNASTQIVINSDSTVVITAAAGTTINGNLLVTGTITSQSTVSDSVGTMSSIRSTYNSHTHPGDSGGTTGTPNQAMS